MNKYELSFWEWDQYFRDLDVVIIGSGIVGLSAAIQLKETAPNLSVTVVDRGVLPLGGSTRNAGFACIGSMSELLADLAHHERDEVLELVTMRHQGLRRLRARYGDKAIDYQAVGGYELFQETDQERYEACCSEMEQFNNDLRHRIPTQPDWPAYSKDDIFTIADKELPKMAFGNVKHLIFNRAEGKIDTGRLVRTMLQRAKALEIDCLNGLNISDLQTDQGKVHLHTAHGWSFKARQVLVATNGFARQLLPQLNVIPARNQVLITQPIPNLHLNSTFHYDQGYVYFRAIGDRLLLGGGRNIAAKEEETAELGSHTAIRKYLLDILQQQIFPHKKVEVDRWWSGILGVGVQKRPLIEEVAPSVHIAVRMGGMGVAIGTLVGEAAAKRLLA